MEVLEPVRGTALRHGQLWLLDELVACDPQRLHEQSVRVVGRVTGLDLCHSRASISHAGASLQVDIILLDPQTMPLRLSTLVQIIGEIVSDGSLLLRARVCRVVDGLNMALYEKAVALQRSFICGLTVAQ